MKMTNADRRQIMGLAWELFREGGRSFAQALKGAWRITKGIATAARDFMARAVRNGGRVQFGSPISSPIDRQLGGRRYASVLSRRAAYTTARLGG